MGLRFFQSSQWQLLAFTGSMLVLTGCGQSSNANVPDHNKIMDRTIAMILKYDEILAVDDIQLTDDEMLKTLTGDLFAYINQSPRPYRSNIGIALNADASFKGFDDTNSDNRQDPGEKKLFTMEVDVENETLVYTAENGEHHGYRMRGSGFFLGAIWGGMGEKQKQSGVKPGRFANAAVNTQDYGGPKYKARASGSTSSSARTKKASSSTARSKARSGGVRSGK
ncbi:MAG: hypothetical protein AAGL18_09955 [Pseudomonadota bacterium]